MSDDSAPGSMSGGGGAAGVADGDAETGRRFLDLRIAAIFCAMASSSSCMRGGSATRRGTIGVILVRASGACETTSGAAPATHDSILYLRPRKREVRGRVVASPVVANIRVDTPAVLGFVAPRRSSST